MLVLSLHPVAQTAALVLAVYAAFLGLKRASTLHFAGAAVFRKERHVITGGLSLAGLLLGMAGGAIIVARYLEKPIFESLHGKGALVILPFLIFGLFSGFYLYLKPAQRRALPAIHGLNNLVILLLAIFQLVTGLGLFWKLIITPG